MTDVKKAIEKNAPKQIGLTIESMLKTGRLATQSGLDLQQVFSCQAFMRSTTDSFFFLDKVTGKHR